jgi:lactoylglutathione lyase
MLSHVCTGITDFERALAFYSKVLAELGLAQTLTTTTAPVAGWSKPGQRRPSFFIGTPFDGEAATAGNGQMTAFEAEDRASVDRAYAAALAHGGSGEGEPGLRPHYHENYYAAYFRDPDGNKLCAVCHSA